MSNGAKLRCRLGQQSRYNLAFECPLITTFDVDVLARIRELLWFIDGRDNLKQIPQSPNVKATASSSSFDWSTWRALKETISVVADEYNDKVGYYEREGYLLRYHDGNSAILQRELDQVSAIIQRLKSRSYSRELVLRHPPEAKGATSEITLTFSVTESHLHCHLHQANADLINRHPRRLAVAGIFTSMLAQQSDLVPGELVSTASNAFIDRRYIDNGLLSVLISRPSRPTAKLHFLRKPESIFDYKIEDFQINNYQPFPAIEL